MAMLSGPRRRKQLHVVPRGNPLYEDTSNIATKMLEKMGWTKGKGLGKDEHGPKDFVRVSYKNDTLGVGFDPSRDDQWTEHESNFNGLLQSLNEDDATRNDENNVQIKDAEITATRGCAFRKEVGNNKGKLRARVSGESLEEKSKNSKARVHYKKFTKCKDIAQYSEKDLANIFGKKVEAEESEMAYGIYNGNQESHSIFEAKMDSSIEYFKPTEDCNEKVEIGNDNEEFSLVDKQSKKRENNEDVATTKIKKSKLNKKDRLKVQMSIQNNDENDDKVVSGYGEVGMGTENLAAQHLSQAEIDKNKLRVPYNENECVEAGKLIETPCTTENCQGEDKAEKHFNENSECSLQLTKRKRKKNKKCIDSEKQNLVEEKPVLDTVEDTKGDLSLQIEKKKRAKKTKCKTSEEDKHSKYEERHMIVKKRKKVEKISILQDDYKSDDAKTNHPSIESTEDDIKVQQEKVTKHVKKTKILTSVNEDMPCLNESILLTGNDSGNPTNAGDDFANDVTNSLARKDSIIKTEASNEDNIKVKNGTKKSKKSRVKSSPSTELPEAANEATDSQKSPVVRAVSDDVTEDVPIPHTESTAIKDVSGEIANYDSSITDENSSGNEDTSKEVFSLENLIAKCDSFKAYTISSYCAEKFSHANLDSFVGSNLQEVIGYGLREDLQLNVIVAKDDEKRIQELWDCTISKYKHANPKQIYNKYIREAYAARQTKRKVPQFHLKSLKRKQIFAAF